jgi:hypothetical protein
MGGIASLGRSKPIVFAGLVGLAVVGSARLQDHNYKPPEGYVPDAETAVAIAKAVLIPVYGKEHIAKEQPFAAKLSRGVWTVEGWGGKPGTFIGGTALVMISKKTGAVVRMTHGR